MIPFPQSRVCKHTASTRYLEGVTLQAPSVYYSMGLTEDTPYLCALGGGGQEAASRIFLGSLCFRCIWQKLGANMT